MRNRIISAIVLGLPIIGLVIVGGWVMSLLILVISSLALWEFAQLSRKAGHSAFPVFMYLFMALFIANWQFPSLDLLAPGIALLMFLMMARTLYAFTQGDKSAITGFALTLAGAFWVGWSLSHYVALRALEPDGVFWTFTVVVAVWAADTFAQFTGMLIGKGGRKLIPRISPNKTWRGYIGGVVGSTLLSALLPLGWRALGASAAVTPLRGAILGALISVFAVVGDLGISVLKRYAGADDSSNLIPGHGGFLDRSDTIIVGALIGYYILTRLMF